MSVAVTDVQAARIWSDEPDYFEYDDSHDVKWKEVEVTLPPYPRDDNLRPLPLPPEDRVKAYIDSASLSRAADQVIRYTLVVESPSGVRSVFYDGMRCETREYKTYAIGTLQRSLAPVKDARWWPIAIVAHNAFRNQLYRDYFCDPTAKLRSSEDLRRLFPARP